MCAGDWFVSDEMRAKRVIEQRKKDRSKMLDGMREEHRHQATPHTLHPTPYTLNSKHPQHPQL